MQSDSSYLRGERSSVGDKFSHAAGVGAALECGKELECKHFILVEIYLTNKFSNTEYQVPPTLDSQQMLNCGEGPLIFFY